MSYNKCATKPSTKGNAPGNVTGGVLSEEGGRIKVKSLSSLKLLRDFSSVLLFFASIHSYLS